MGYWSEEWQKYKETSIVSSFVYHAPHHGTAVKVGPHTVIAAAGRDLDAADLIGKVDVLVNLGESARTAIESATEKGWTGLCASVPMRDYGCWSVPVLRYQAERVLQWAAGGWKVGVCCVGGHGRTGTLIAAGIAIAEPEVEDPVEAVRQRHCRQAIESDVQIKAIFTLAGRQVPERYLKKSAPPFPTRSATPSRRDEAGRFVSPYSSVDGRYPSTPTNGLSMSTDPTPLGQTWSIVGCPNCKAKQTVHRDDSSVHCRNCYRWFSLPVANATQAQASKTGEGGETT